MSAFEKQHTSKEDQDLEWKIVELPVVDNGYYDTLAAMGFAALADSYYDTPKTPLIEWTPKGFQIHYVEKLRSTPDLQWLKYSLAASWKSDIEIGVTKIAKGWDNETRLRHEGAVIDTSEKPMIKVKIDGKQRNIVKPDRRLYGAINKLGKPDWINLCVSACRERGIELLGDDFEEKSVTFNSIVSPHSSRGANSKNSYSIGTGPISKTVSGPLSRLTCLAVAGLCYSAIGESPTGFAAPIPLRIRIEAIRKIAIENRKRYSYSGFFFPFSNYLRFVKLLLINATDFEAKFGEAQKLKGVTGSKFIELGNSESPAGVWQLMVPSHEYSVDSVESFQKLLKNWRKAVTPPKGGDPAINRKAVSNLMTGFEQSDPALLASGYLSFASDTGFLKKDGNGKQRITFYPLNQNTFEEIMAHKSKYKALLKAFKSEEIQKFITLVRDETYKKVFNGMGKESEHPNYQMMRKLREIQNSEDFINALTEIAINRGTNKLASEMTDENEMRFMVMPYEGSIDKLIQLSEKYPSKTLANLLLAFALSKESKN